MDQVAPPLFKQGPSAFARLFFFAVLALTLLVADTRFDALRYVRVGLGTALYPVQRGVLAPTQWVGNFFGYFQRARPRSRPTTGSCRSRRTRSRRPRCAPRAWMPRTSTCASSRVCAKGCTSKAVAAEILYDARDPFSRKVIIDRGTNDGVDRGQPVIDESGVVGQITRVFPLSSEITLLTDREQAIAVQNVRTGVRGIAYGNAAGGPAGQVDLRFMPSNVDVQKGDLLATSGLDGVFPVGLPVARVLSVERNAAYQFARILCAPLGGTERNRHVLILLTEKTTARPAEEPPAPTPKGKRSRMP